MGYILCVLGCVIILFSLINFAKARDIFCAIHFVIIANIYGLSLLLFGMGILNFAIISFIKIIALILLNIIATIIITHCLSRQAAKKVIIGAEIVKTEDLKNDQ
jgi:multisubunit Na+/H+ antiporter MnhG subunit